ncbi:uncharacterized protein LOC127899077 [Citrus sinensis]|uniref:uncharacterized protein LOC127899077 n=1 Tax=Citrus sinensis TaxID=2711 RepID=UPI0022784B87|nr:uncharacterized protein LOC127899077 [Citrus sinensis]
MTDSTPAEGPLFTFVLEYMGSGMMIQTVRPTTYTVERLCNIAALVLQKKESPKIHRFHPKAVLPWGGHVVEVNGDESLKNIIRQCITNGEYNVRLVVMFDGEESQVATFDTPTRILGVGDQVPSVCVGREHKLEEGIATKGQQPTGKRRDGGGSKRIYRCSICSGDSHGKRTCKVVRTLPPVAPSNSQERHLCNPTEDEDFATNEDNDSGSSADSGYTVVIM